MQELDPRIVKVSIQVNGQVKTYSGIAITASGTKYANALQNECTVTLSNLDRATQDYILTETSPYNLNRTPKSVIIEAGRQSYGTTRIYTGNIVTASVSQPPDIAITLKCLTGNFLKGTILSHSQAGTATLKQVSDTIAQSMALRLNFQASNKSVGNYRFAGAALKQVGSLNGLGGINAFVDDDTLVVKDALVPLSGTARMLSAENGMIGIPQFTEQGIKVKFLLDNISVLGGGLIIQSVQYPAINGNYVIYKLGFEIANRDTPFYYIAEAARLR